MCYIFLVVGGLWHCFTHIHMTVEDHIAVNVGAPSRQSLGAPSTLNILKDTNFESDEMTSIQKEYSKGADIFWFSVILEIPEIH